MNSYQLNLSGTIANRKINDSADFKIKLSEKLLQKIDPLLKKHLVIFDFDHTIIEGESFFEMIKLLPEWGEENTKQLFEKKGNWFLFAEEIMNILKENKVKACLIKEHFKKVNVTKYFADLLEFLFSNKEKFDIHIISGSYDIFVKWILEHHGFFHIIDEVHCEKAIVEDDFIKFIQPKEYIKCPECHFCVCKAKTFKNIINSTKFFYERMHYIGDGINDFCPSLILDHRDFLYPRKNYKLYKKIYEENYDKKINSQIISWVDGNCILNNFKDLFKNKEEIEEK